MTWNFWLNRRTTFADAQQGSVLRQYPLFALSCSLGALTSWCTSMLLSHTLPFFAAHPLLAAVLGVIGGAGVNYTFCAAAVFRPAREPGAEPAHGVRALIHRFAGIPKPQIDDTTHERPAIAAVDR